MQHTMVEILIGVVGVKTSIPFDKDRFNTFLDKDLKQAAYFEKAGYGAAETGNFLNHFNPW